jgi:flagellar hook-associated protein 3 FlgL
MLPSVNASSEQFLTDLDRIQSAIDTTQRQVSSGLRVGKASDDPSALSSILGTQSEIALNKQAQTNLNQVKTELQVGDSALQQAVKLMDQAITLAAQAGSTLGSDTQNAVLASQVQGVQEALVGLSNTSVNGRYIFSGDSARQAAYALDATEPSGVRQVSTASSTRVITDANGNPLWTPQTAREIFDAQGGTGNVFTAIDDLLTAFQKNDRSAALATMDSLKAAADHVNQQLGLYGIAETRVDDATTAAAKSVTTGTQSLSSLRDADTAGDAVELTQLGIQQQAALSARAKMSQSNLFDFLA